MRTAHRAQLDRVEGGRVEHRTPIAEDLGDLTEILGEGLAPVL